MERRPQESSATTEEQSGEADSIAQSLEEAAAILRNYELTHESDSVKVQKLRKQEYNRAWQILKGLPFEAKQSRRVIRLTVGSEQIKTQRLVGSSDVYRYAGPIMAPGETLLLKTTRSLMDTSQPYEQRFNTVYIGDHGRMLELAGLAKVLASEGSLELVPLEPSESEE